MDNTKAAEPLRSPDKLKLLIAVVNREKSEYYADYIQSFGVNVHYFVSAHGTSKSYMLDFIGLSGDDRKSVILGAVSAERAPALLEGLDNKFKTIKNGKGVAFTVPFASVIGVTAYRFLADKRD
ncbi:MAG: hypothetical protein II135_10275 [Clostridia bacterium]|jgi:hypothetical protein|nr:hypothetical protein [Clostridia bacterium]MBQ3869057.1 hypothetical protein [Clostridia bacterium]